MSQRDIKEALEKYRIIVVVGLSSDTSKPSNQVASYMKEHGYTIVPINPTVSEVLGEKSYPSLLDLPEDLQKTIEVIDIFRRSTDVLPIVQEAVRLRWSFGKPLMVWMQLGIVNHEAAEMAQKAGIIVVMDRCIKVEHQKMC